MKNLSLSVLATALLAANAANAAEVFKNDTSSVDLYGRIYAGHTFSSNKSEEGSEISYIRLGAKAKTQITADLYGQGRIEYEFNKFQERGKEAVLDVRQAWAGLGGDFGLVSYGRQYGAVTLVADYTDVLYEFGNDAIGTGTDVYGTGKSSDLLKYSGSFGGLSVDASYQLKNDRVSTDDDSVAAYGIAAEYALDMGLAFSAGYALGENTGDTDDFTLALVGVKYDANNIYAALTYSDGENGNTDLEGLEAALGYSFGNGAELLAGYNKADVDNTTEVDYYTLGAQYKFNKNLRTFIEHKFENIDGADDVTAVVVRYDF